MKLLLIYPPQNQIVLPSYKRSVQEGLGFLPPLGLLCLAAYLLENTHHSVELLDAHVERLDAAALEARVRSAQPEAVGITATTFTLLDALDVARTIKRIDPELPVILGGPHTALFPRESVELPCVDYVVLGEGEIPLAALLDRIEETGRLPGTGWRGDDGRPVGPSIVEDLPAVLDKKTTQRKVRFFVDDLDVLPVPRRDLLPWRRYGTVVSKRPPTTVIMSSRGCPFGCSFCYTAGGKKVRARHPEAVVREMHDAVTLGIHEFLFFDETFTLDRDRVHAICDRIIEQRLDVTWDVRARVDCVDAGLLRHMRRAGCERVQYGIEAGTQRVMDALQKGTTIEQARDAIRWTREAGLSTYADFMIGGPGETREEMLQTLDFATSLDLDYVHFSVTEPLPNTPLHRLAVKKGIITDDTWRAFARNPTPDFEVPCWTEMLERRELEELVMQCIKSCYLRPAYVIRSLGKVGSLGELVRKARAGLKLAVMGF